MFENDRLLLLALVITHTLVYSISYENAFHSYCSFLLILALFMQPCPRLTELNVSLFYLIDFCQKYLMKTTTC